MISNLYKLIIGHDSLPQLWGRTFLESFRVHADPNRAGGGGGVDTDSGDDEEDGGQRPQIRVMPGRTRISIRRNNPGVGLGPAQGTLQGIIEQLLSGLTGGAMMGGAGGGGPMPL